MLLDLIQINYKLINFKYELKEKFLTTNTLSSPSEYH